MKGIAALADDHFVGRVAQRGTTADVYGLRFENKNWYIKFVLEKNSLQETSFYPPAKRLKTVSREECEQKDIAAHLGVTGEYLSEIKSGRKIPKFQTFNFLKTLALDPKSFEISSSSHQSWKIAKL